jgi:hypothetical protein
MTEVAGEPDALLRLSPSDADRLLDRLEQDVPTRPSLVRVGDASSERALVFGDSHGDWRSTREVVRRFEASGPGTWLVGLGDYVDRSPAGLPNGSVVNALYLLGVAARYPGRVVLIQGNHETDRRLPVRPRDLPREVAAMWGTGPERLRRLASLLERGPLAAWTESGLYLAHAGFPRGALPNPWTSWFDRIDDERLAELVWPECGASDLRRGVVPAFTAEELDRFLAASGRTAFLRGHDPDLTGRRVFGNRCLTLHTTSVYQQYGGILLATMPLRGRAADLGAVTVEHLSTERSPDRGHPIG